MVTFLGNLVCLLFIFWPMASNYQTMLHQIINICFNCFHLAPYLMVHGVILVQIPVVWGSTVFIICYKILFIENNYITLLSMSPFVMFIIVQMTISMKKSALVRLLSCHSFCFSFNFLYVFCLICFSERNGCWLSLWGKRLCESTKSTHWHEQRRVDGQWNYGICSALSFTFFFLLIYKLINTLILTALPFINMTSFLLHFTMNWNMFLVNVQFPWANALILF